MNFGKAFEEVKKGKAMRLPQWSKDVMIKAQFPDENSKMTAPYLYVESRYSRVPWKETFKRYGINKRKGSDLNGQI